MPDFSRTPREADARLRRLANNLALLSRLALPADATASTTAITDAAAKAAIEELQSVVNDLKAALAGGGIGKV